MKVQPMSTCSYHAQTVAKVYWDYCAEGVLVQEFASNALSLSQKEAVNRSGVSFVMAVAELAEVFAETAFVHGYIHDVFACAHY